MKLQALTGAFGAEVEGLNLGQGVNARDMQLIAEALAEKSVLVFRDQDLDIGQFEDLATSMGEFGETPFITPVEGHPNVLKVLREADEEGPLFGSGWHSDWSFQAQPPSSTLL